MNASRRTSPPGPSWVLPVRWTSLAGALKGEGRSARASSTARASRFTERAAISLTSEASDSTSAIASSSVQRWPSSINGSISMDGITSPSWPQSNPIFQSPASSWANVMPPWTSTAIISMSSISLPYRGWAFGR